MRFLREKISLFIFLIFILSIAFYGGNAQAYYGGLGSITNSSGTTYFNTPTPSYNNFSGLSGGLSGLGGLYGGSNNVYNQMYGASGSTYVYGYDDFPGLGGLYGGLSGLGGLYGGLSGLGGFNGGLGLGGLYGGLGLGGLSGLGGLYGGLSGLGGFNGGLGLGGLYGGLGLGGLSGLGGLYGIGNSYGGLYGAYNQMYGTSGLGSLYGYGDLYGNILGSSRLGYGDSLSLIRQPQVVLPGTTTSLPAVGGGGGLPDPTGIWSGTWLSYINLKGGIANFNLIYDPLTLTVSGTAALLLNKLIPLPINVIGVNTAAGVILTGSYFDLTKLVTYYAEFTCVLVSPLFITGDYTIHDALFLETDIGEFNLNLVL